MDRDESFASVMAALAANVVIAIAKGTAAALTGSPALLAETLHTTADAGNEIFLWIAIRRSRRPADATHPFGYTVVNGGGGFGDPLRRDPAAVERDLADGLVSPAAAAAVYGVVPGDEAATAALRDDIRAARLREGSYSGALERLDGGEVLHRVADTVEAVAVDGARHLRCTVCGHRFGDYGADHKRASSLRELPITAHSELNALGLTDLFVLREFSCPGCGTAVAVDVQRRDEPILDESRLRAP